MEYKKKVVNNTIISKLLKLTHNKRREDISACCVRLTAILERYPFFSSKLWVCHNTYTCTHAYAGSRFLIQVFAEFEMMVGDGKIKLMKDNWEKHLPSIIGSAYVSSVSHTALTSFDKNFRSGPTYKQPGAFQIHKVL